MPELRGSGATALVRRPWTAALIAALVLGFTAWSFGIAQGQEAQNGAPSATDDTFITEVGVAIDIHVLANDSDPDGDVLEVSEMTQPANGSVSPNADGTLRYTPDEAFTGTDTFVYIAADPEGEVDAATVTIHVVMGNRPPTAVDDTAVTRAGVPVTVDVLANDSDADGDSLMVMAAAPVDGSVVINLDDTVTFTPDPGFIGHASFTYIVTDGEGSAEGTVTVTVLAPNTAPVAVADHATTKAGQAVTINVLANDSDADSQTLSITGVADPPRGTAVVMAGQVVYTPNVGFVGVDTFTYTISDGFATAVGTMTVTVQAIEAPVVDRAEAAEFKSACKDGGWVGFGFSNQGLCVSFFARLKGQHLVRLGLLDGLIAQLRARAVKEQGQQAVIHQRDSDDDRQRARASLAERGRAAIADRDRDRDDGRDRSKGKGRGYSKGRGR